MMMNGVMLDDSMSNLTSASNEASISSSNRNEVIGGGILYPQAPNQPPPPKKKRNLPGNPAHSKICGTREYRCDCGTLFPRRDSFITHRAFCDALAEETTRSSNHLTPNPFFSSQTTPHFSLQNNFPVALKTEVQDQTHTQSFNQLPPWLGHQPNPVDLPTQLFSPRFENPNPSPQMSATALLQKAAQMGVTMSKNGSSTASETVLIRPHQLAHMSSGPASGMGLASCDDMGNGLLFGNIKAGGGGNVSVSSGCMEQVGATMMSGGGGSLPCGSGFDGSSSSASAFEEALNGMLMNPKMDPFLETTHLRRSNEGGGGGGNEGLTRDFLGLRGFSHGGFPNMARFDQINNTSSSSSYGQQNQSRTPWQG
ncbi:C2H2-like zinc finger protein [Actinidia rufa]|uniref:C2H2-like zinc finger protein n=1 Tax=Actinidia rufa TaxID=165716 RepID=A0A7J0GCT8_9ERIC|nr:C2H2-like zinc finger protein [Actinidia rufa]